MTARRVVMVLGSSAMACLAACGRSGSPQPPPLTYGVQACAVCNMIISDERYAAAIVFADSAGDDSAVFDDIGCLLLFEEQHADRPVAARFVRLAGGWGSRWMPADTAFFVQSPGLQTPMGYGLAAYASRDEADVARIEYGGEVFDYAPLKRLVQSGSLRVVNSEGTQP